jgi:hypothetical protein
MILDEHWIRAHDPRVKNITFSADECLIEAARSRAREERQSLNDVFRAWLRRYAGRGRGRADLDGVYAQLDGVEAGRTFRRDEMNER